MSDINRDDQLNITEDVTVQRSYIPIDIDDQINLAEDITVQRSYIPIDIDDQINLAEDITVEPDPAIDIFTQLDITEDIVVVPDPTIEVFAQLDLTEDSHLTIPTLEIGVFDLLNVIESIIPVLEGNVSVIDDLTLSEDIETTLEREIGVESSLTITEETTIVGQFINVSDELNITEETDEEISDINVNLFDLLNVTEFISRQGSLSDIGVFDLSNITESRSIAAPFESGVQTLQRYVVHKLYDHDNNFIRVLDEVSSHLAVEKNLFSGSGPLTLTFNKKVDELPADITFNNKIKIYVKNKWENELKLVYYGYIISIDPSYSAGNEQTGVTCLGNISKLQNDFLRIDDNDLAYEVAPSSIGTHIQTIIDHYLTTIDDRHGNKDRAMLEETSDYWSSSSYIEDTNEIGLIPHRYFNSKHLDAINEICKFLPKNDSMGQYWYWYLTDEGKFILKKLSTTAEHTLILGKHCTFSMRNNIESLINRVYFWNERGDYAGEKIRTKYEDTTSQEQFDVIADRITDTQVTTHTQGRLLAEGSLMDRKDNQYQATVEVSEAQYNILSFKPGQVVKIQNIKDEDLFADRMIITKVLLQENLAVLSLSTPRPDLTTQVETDREFIDKQLRWFGEIITRIDGSRIYTGVQHWITKDIVFAPDGNNKMTWTAGSFQLSNDVKRVIAAGELDSMTTTEDYFVYLDEENKWSTKDTSVAPATSGTGSIREGENFLVDDGASWTTDQYKGYVLWVDPAVGSPQKYIISRNTTTVLYVEGYSVFRENDSNASYEIHKFVLRPSSKISEEGSANSGSTTTLVDSSRNEADNHWNGFKMKILSGSNAGMLRTISSFSSNTLTFPTLPYSIDSGVQYSLYLGAETQILIAMASPKTEVGSEVVIVPQIPAVIPEYQCDGATRAYEGLNDFGDLIRDVINSNLNTQTREILSGFNFGVSGAINIPGYGSAGVWISPAGILGKDTGGSTTFAITASDGSATFKGIVAAGSVIATNIAAEQILAGTLIGFTIQTAPSFPYVLIGGGAEWIKFYDTLGEQATLYAYNGSLLIHGARSNSNIFLNTGDEGVHVFTSGWNILGYMAKGVTRIERAFQLPIFGWSSDVSSGTGKYYFVIDRRLHNLYLFNLHARHLTAGSGVGSTSIQIYNVTQGRNLLSTTLTVNSGHLGSETATIPYVVDSGGNQVREWDLIRVDISSVPATAPKCLILTIGFSCYNSWTSA